MRLKLIKASREYQTPIVEMLKEWTDYNNTHGCNQSPSAIFKNDYHDFDHYVENLEVTDSSAGLVPDSTFFCFDEDGNACVGAVNIRHRLNEYLLKSGGHIGDGVRPSARRKGIATKMIGLALEECKKLNIDRVLMVCDKDNVGSSKSIISNGGVLENEVMIDGVVKQRYWIHLS
ncbi:GNAT family N-acetyltransferase [Eubacteriales bacterium OttesenSCG-928-N13]|nr:GNAT family N-acetyltransferase [Eubacteriales bacterium OttesenSCG-928-N13]